MTDNPSINPYNFVPLKDEPARTAWDKIPKHHRLTEELYSGRLDLRFFTLTPVFIPSTRFEDCDNQNDKVTLKRFNHDDESRPILPGSSIRGMLRAVFEALTNSCMVHFTGKYEWNEWKNKQKTKCSIIYSTGDYTNKKCNYENGLCPACAVFGMVSEGDKNEGRVNRSRVIFTDAIGKAADLVQGEWILKPLQEPKPRHVAFYAKDGKTPASGPRGRKFYFHHDPEAFHDLKKSQYFSGGTHDKNNRKILELVRKGAYFTGALLFQGLREQELADLLFALELESKVVRQGDKEGIVRVLAHKIGMGKPLGLGSVGISIVGGRIQEGSGRYKTFEDTAVPLPELRRKIEELRQKAVKPDDTFQNLLSCVKHQQGSIGYPGYDWFREDDNRSKILGLRGEFEKEFEKENPNDFVYNEIISGKIELIESDRRHMFVRADDGRLFRRQMQIQGLKLKDFVVGRPVVLDGKAVRLK